ncbi:ribosome small subunit-dependent GTPase A, partial [Myxococcota bacterium]|nr:ribosome small subunit-dependent GTPase A [Myxococcota bacterium]
MYTLIQLGLTPFFSNQAASSAVLGRVAAEHRGGNYDIWAHNAVGRAHLPNLTTPDGNIPAVGDWVVLSGELSEDFVRIETVLERATCFTRAAAGRESRLQVIAANVDTVFVVCGLDNDYSVNRIERYVARVWASGAQPVVVLSKSDLDEDKEAHKAEVEGSCPGVDVVFLSSLSGEGIGALEPWITEGKTVALVGSSGAGKSTLVNVLAGEELLKTSQVSPRDQRGCHTTTHRQLAMLPSGAMLLDTPGMREFSLSDDEGVDEVFTDIASWAAGCRYRDCGHEEEPGCAVRFAVEQGDLPAERLAHFLALKREAAAWERRH